MSKKIDYSKVKDKRIVMLQSGGLDSNIITAIFNYYDFEVHHVFVDYGQNSRENEKRMAESIVKYYNEQGGDNTLHCVTLDIPWLKESTKLVGGEVSDWETGHGVLNTIEEATYVPMRNLMLLSIASSLCESLNIPNLGCAFDGAQTFLTHHPMCGTTDKHPNFVSKVEKAIVEGSSLHWNYNKSLKIYTPVMDLFKHEIIELGLEYGANMALSWSCYNNSEKPCMKCSACKERSEAFEYLGLKDLYFDSV